MAKKEQNRASDRKYHYTYLIKDNIHNKFYYGVHSTDFNPEDINQYHSSSKHLKLMINSFGIDNFTKYVRRYFSSRVMADEWEHKVLRRMKVRSRKDFYNQSEGGVGYVTSGYVVVRCLETGKTLRVSCDDPYINTLYEPIAKGKSLPEAQKRALSELYKGKWSGLDNTVHELKDSDAWVRTVSERSVGRNLSEVQIGNLKDYSQWKHLVNYSNTKDVQDRMNFHRSINNIKYANIYLYKGEVYLHKHELPVNIKVKSIEILPEKHPLVPVLSARGKLYPDIKTAATSLGVVSGTLANRIKSDHSYWQDHYFLSDEIVSSSKTLSEKEFRSSMRQKYKDTLEEQKKYVKPFSVGASDEDLSKVFMDTGKFLKGTTFSRINEKR